ncbi:MAG: protein arginine kinase [Phycisphaerae bacterium]|nr:protein arginine kinase [Phycisphaerae bacterium]
MTLDYRHVATWMRDAGPLSDIVISSRVRLARNIKGFQFLSKADAQQKLELLEYIRAGLMNSDLANELTFLKIQDTSPLEREILVERHLISKHLANSQSPGGLALSADESLAVMVNEEDHLRLQAMSGGQQLMETYQRLVKIENILDERIQYAFSPDFGYLTACPTNVGTGIRVSVMLHLPALKLTGQLDKIFRAANDMKLAVRGFFGEGTEPVGDMFQLSNQTTLGKTEIDIINDLISEAVVPVVDYERKAREALMDEKPIELDDKIFRALGVLTNARMIASEEAMYQLSLVRLGINLGRIEGISLETINDLFLFIQPAHLQYMNNSELNPLQRDMARADYIRHRLQQ